MYTYSKCFVILNVSDLVLSSTRFPAGIDKVECEPNEVLTHFVSLMLSVLKFEALRKNKQCSVEIEKLFYNDQQKLIEIELKNLKWKQVD